METTIEQNQKNETGSVKNINYTNGVFTVEDEKTQLNSHDSADHLPGVQLNGIQYYDLKNVGYISNTGMAGLISLLKSLLKQDVETQFVNVNAPIRERITSLGLDKIIKCV
jgi:hypothetical protein